MDYWQQRVDLASAFRWTVRLNMHEAVANHFSLLVGDGKQYLMNPNQKHFSRIKASDLLLLDVDGEFDSNLPDSPDPTALGLHGQIHALCPHAKCVMHTHAMFSTVLACLEDSSLPPIDQNTATFYNRYVIDNDFGGLAFAEEGKRCAALLSNPKVKIMIMGNHGMLAIGDSVADTLNSMYYFERAAETYIRALQTAQPLRIISNEIAEKTAKQLENYPGQATKHLSEIQEILKAEGDDFDS